MPLSLCWRSIPQDESSFQIDVIVHLPCLNSLSAGLGSLKYIIDIGIILKQPIEKKCGKILIAFSLADSYK